MIDIRTTLKSTRPLGGGFGLTASRSHFVEMTFCRTRISFFRLPAKKRRDMRNQLMRIQSGNMGTALPSEDVEVAMALKMIMITTLAIVITMALTIMTVTVATKLAMTMTMTTALVTMTLTVAVTMTMIMMMVMMIMIMIMIMMMVMVIMIMMTHVSVPHRTMGCHSLLRTR
eukprot:Rmarinus@m.5417